MFNYSRLLGSEQCFRVVTKETGSHEVFAGGIYFGFRFGRNRCYRIVCRLYVPHRPTHVFCDIFLYHLSWRNNGKEQMPLHPVRWG